MANKRRNYDIPDTIMGWINHHIETRTAAIRAAFHEVYHDPADGYIFEYDTLQEAVRAYHDGNLTVQELGLYKRRNRGDL